MAQKKPPTARRTKVPTDTPRPSPRRRGGKKGFRVVAMGGSAGGLEAFEQFFSKMPADSGMAFVLVPHLDPTHKALLAELLQRSTKMKVVEVKDGMDVRPDAVYVIPPNADLSILHGKLHLLEPSTPRGTRMPIDFFFRQLALDQHDKAIGIVLSGMGSDGTQGIRAIKENFGLVMVQDPGSAKYDAMPRSAINTGLADYVAPVGDLPVKLVQYVTHAPRPPKSCFPPRNDLPICCRRFSYSCGRGRGTIFRAIRRARSSAASSGG